MGTWWNDYARNVIEGMTFEPQRLQGVGSNNGAAVDMRNAQEGHFAELHIGTITGTSTTLDVTLEESEDGSTGWTAITDFITGNPAAFSQKDGTEDVMDVINFKRSKRYVRAVATLAGNSPAYDLSVTLHGMARRVT